MPSPERPRPARSLFERAEITTQDVVLFALVYGVLQLALLGYVWWKKWGQYGEDPAFTTLRVMFIAWLLAFILLANAAIRLRLRKVARRDRVTPEVLLSQVEAAPVQTNRERVLTAAALIGLSAFACYGIWWWRYARDGQVTEQDTSSLKFAFGMWFVLSLIVVVQALSGARNARRQLEAQRAERVKKMKCPERLPGDDSSRQP